MALSEQQLFAWSRPVSTTEDAKCNNAIKQVTEAIKAKFGSSVTIFLQGSYNNDTNIKQDSDVDIVVRANDYYYPDLYFLSEQDREIYNSTRNTSQYTFAQFKGEVHDALRNFFGRAERKNKCIYVPGNTNRVNADVVPCFVSKRFSSPTKVSAEGIELVTDAGEHLTSYPEQHYLNGVTKNTSTNRMYKRTVRILKKIKSELVEQGTITEKLVSSFMIECLVYNVPSSNFISNNYYATLRNIITKIYNDMDNPEIANNYEEVSGLKWLFKGTGKSPADSKQFVLKCWQYGGFQ